MTKLKRAPLQLVNVTITDRTACRVIEKENANVTTTLRDRGAISVRKGSTIFQFVKVSFSCYYFTLCIFVLYFEIHIANVSGL